MLAVFVDRQKCDIHIAISIILTLLFWLPAILHAAIVSSMLFIPNGMFDQAHRHLASIGLFMYDALNGGCSRRTLLLEQMIFARREVEGRKAAKNTAASKNTTAAKV